MGDGNSTTGISLANITGFVIWIRHENVPFSINHVGVEVVRSTWMICIIPSIDKRRFGLVSDINQSHGNLSRVTPLTNIRICISGIYQLILNNNVFSTIVFEIFHIQNLCIWVDVYSRYNGICWICHIDNMHFRPSGKVGIGSTIGGIGHLHFGIARCS